MSGAPARIRTVAWRGVDDPDRLDIARYAFGRSSFAVAGTSVTVAYTLHWSLATSEDWVTRVMRVDLWGPRWDRHLELRRAPDGDWTADAYVRGIADLPAAGLADRASLAGALDCDLALCPATNTMPVLRLGLVGTDPRPATDTPMAFIDVPSLAVTRSDQRYWQAAPPTADGAAVGFAAAPDYRNELFIDSDGLVLRYPGLAVAL